MEPILAVARDLGLNPDDVTVWGRDKAKVSLDALAGHPPRGRLILVSAITPTSAGEGKTVTTISLAQGLATTGRRACAVLREPSLGPTFGLKGGATGGGRATIVPSDDINLHFTGDFHAVTAAHNLLAALLDNHLHRGNRLGIDTRRVLWRRVLDVNDRALRHVVVGMGGPLHGVPRQSGFDITAASEVMAVLCLATDHDDLRRRLGRMVVALNGEGHPVTTSDLKAVGGMLVLLKDALCPNLVQTAEGIPALVHGGPFANIAHGCNSTNATKLALRYADWAVTEAGFGFDLGGEKFFDLKCVAAGLNPAAVVLVTTVRALKHHAGVAPASLADPDAPAVERGLPNLVKQVENVRQFGEGPVVALNRFSADSDEEIGVVRAACERLAVPFAVNDGFAHGGPGAVELAEQVVLLAERHSTRFTPLYERSEPITRKMETVARAMYGAHAVVWNPQAERDLDVVKTCGGESLPLCVAKTQSSLSDNPKRLGRPTGFEMTVNRVILAAGAGYVVPVLGRVQLMPGLPAAPQAEDMDLHGDDMVGVS